MHKKVEIKGKEYYVRRHPRGYGWEIMERTPVLTEQPDGTKEDIGRGTYKSLFRHTEKGPVTYYFDNYFAKGKVFTKFPKLAEPTCPEKMLVHHSKHFTGYYAVPTLPQLEKTMRDILVKEYGDSIEGIKPENMVHNDSGVNSLEEIDSIPIEAVRDEVRKKWNDYMKEIKALAKYTKEWMNLKAVLDGRGHVFSAFEAFEEGRYQYEDLITVD